MINLKLLHPRDQITMIMQRIYGYGMTTTSGGNLSILDDDNRIWITSAGNDKGAFRSEDVVSIASDGSFEGLYKPSSEHPFHQAIFRKRPDIRAVLHAHPPALIAFSLMHIIPDISIVPKAKSVCGKVGMAAYAAPGSEELGEVIANEFAKGYNIVMLENHGVVVAADNLFTAFERFETLDFCARLILKARIIGKEKPLAPDSLAMFNHRQNYLPEYEPLDHSLRELELRKEMCRIIRRAYDQGLVTSTEGTFSSRIDKDKFLITPYGVDRMYIDIDDLIVIDKGKREKGKIPSRSVALHIEIYENEPDINAIVIAHPPNVMAFGVSGVKLDTRIIPESYVVLRDIQTLPYGPQFNDAKRLGSLLTKSNPLLMIENDCLIVTGSSVLQAYDRLEVAEYSAKALIATKPAGTIVPIDEKKITELKNIFGIA